MLFLIYNAFVFIKYPCLPIDYLFFHSATPIFLGATPNLKNRCGAKKNRCGARKFFARSARGATPIQNPVHASELPARFFQRQFLAGVGIGVGKTCTGVPFSPRRRCFSENSMRRRENYQRRRESRQRGILPPLALQRRREGHTHSGGRGAPTGVGREAGLFGQLGRSYTNIYM